MSDWLKNIRIGVIGNGVVGQAVARSYLEHVAEVRCWDILPERRTHPLTSITPNTCVLDCDVVFICLPTPQKRDSLECDTSIVEGFFATLSHAPNTYQDRVRGINYVLRSTVPIGTTRRLAEKYRLPNLVHSPEFLTARCATVDAQMPTRNIIGGAHKEWTGPTDKDEKKVSIGQGEAQLIRLYQERFPHVLVLVMSSDESEAVKLMQNSFFAVKVAFWNEMRCLTDKLGLDWETVRDAILADGRIHPSHTQVPGPDGKYGFGGACLPKDLASLIQQQRDNHCGHDMTFSATFYQRRGESK